MESTSRYDIGDIPRHNRYEDRTLKCIDCGEEFIFATGEQRYFEKRQLVEPKRCPECRQKRKKLLSEREGYED